VQWFCDRATCEPVEGKHLTAHWKIGKSEQKGRAVFKRVIPGSFLELMWIYNDSGGSEHGAGHTLSYEIRSKSDMIELVMIDMDDGATDEETGEILDRGWNSVLMELKDFCERKERLSKPRRTPQVSSRE